MRKPQDKASREEELVKQQHIDILALKRLMVFDENNEKIYFSKFWEKKTIIIFVRHFGCIACRARVDQVSKFYDGINNNKMEVIFIGNGQPHMIKAFKEDLNLPNAKIYTDPSLEVFDACGMNRSLKNLINVKSLKAMRALSKKGYKQGAWDSDSGTHRQMGGVLALDKPGKVLYHHCSEFLGDFDNPSDWPLDND